MIRVIIRGEQCEAIGPFPLPFLKVLSALSGRKKWNGSKSVHFEGNGANIRRLETSDFEIKFEDKTGDLAKMQELESLATQHTEVMPLETNYEPVRPLFAHMVKVLALCADREVYAWLLEMGLCKTGIAIANIGILFLKKKVTGALIFAPKGVHRQWADEIEKDLDKKIERNVLVWNGKEFSQKEMRKKNAITFLCMNIDAARTEKGAKLACDFLKIHNKTSFMHVDESHTIKTGSTERTKAIIALGRMATFRRIATGTPIAKNIIDAWSQFMFLDPRILGHKYMTSFRARYCIMGGFEGRQVVGQRNTEEFYQLIAPHSYRMTKAEALDLPEKIYITREYDMGETTKRHYAELKKTFMTQFEDGSIVDVPSAAVALVRLQQLLCGYLPNPEGDDIKKISDERINEMMEIVRQSEGPVLVWTRFTQTIHDIKAALEKEGRKVVTYYGGTKSKDRSEAIRRVKEEGCDFVSNPAAGGTGVDGLQGSIQTVIYFSNDFNALHRWQSEDRTHRVGMKGVVTYYDLVATKSVDRLIIRNLKGKKSLSDLTLDEIRMAILEK